MSDFPNMVDWMDEFGMNNLHEAHNAWNDEMEEQLSFSDFVNQHYETNKQMWHDDINRGGTLNVPFDAECEVAVESAKAIMKRIIECGIESRMVPDLLTEEDLAPDYHCALIVADEFWKTVVPAVTNALNNL